MNHHLSTQEISARLAGYSTPEVEQHVRECAACRAAFERLEGSLADFGDSVKEWSARQLSQAHAIERTAGEGSYRFGVLRLAAATAVVAIMAAVPIHLRNLAAQRAAESARQDEALLQQVQTEVSRSVPAPMEPLTKLVSWKSDSTK